MAEYRAYVVGLDGHFINFTGFVSSDDDDAIQQAARLVDGHAIELWSGERLIRKSDPKERD
jgi:hypothetical protein